jgi:predicted permease
MSKFALTSSTTTRAMSDVNARLALAVSTIAFGYFLRKIGLVDIDVGKALLKVLFNATLPSVLLVVFASLTFDAQSASVAACALAQAGVLFLAHFAFRGGGREPKDLALMTGSTVGVNLGTFCYPLVDAVWGAEGLTRLVLFDAVNQWSLLVFAPLLYASAVAGKSFSPPAALANVGKQLTSPCMLALFVGVALQVLGWSLPSPVVAFTSSLAAANKPLALLALGILFDPVLRPGQLRDIASLLCLRYGASLLLGAAVLFTTASAMGGACAGVVLAALISPVPLLTVTFAIEYGCDIGLGASAVNLANVCSFALLLIVANADFASPAALAPRVFAAGVALAGLGAAGARRTRRADETPTPAAASASAAARAERFPRRRTVVVGTVAGAIESRRGRVPSLVLKPGVRTVRGRFHAAAAVARSREGNVGTRASFAAVARGGIFVG